MGPQPAFTTHTLHRGSLRAPVIAVTDVAIVSVVHTRIAVIAATVVVVGGGVIGFTCGMAVLECGVCEG
jgi:hypothetical protein